MNVILIGKIMIFWFLGLILEKNFNIGLYTTNPDINVGKLAQEYLNGGGHQGAAGGETKDFIFHPL